MFEFAGRLFILLIVIFISWVRAKLHLRLPKPALIRPSLWCLYFRIYCFCKKCHYGILLNVSNLIIRWTSSRNLQANHLILNRNNRELALKCLATNIYRRMQKDKCNNDPFEPLRRNFEKARAFLWKKKKKNYNFLIDVIYYLVDAGVVSFSHNFTYNLSVALKSSKVFTTGVFVSLKFFRSSHLKCANMSTVIYSPYTTIHNYMHPTF